jgi:S-(hydroxymethyl)glutathione dehydrogenase / alcohol dehydrogenase
MKFKAAVLHTIDSPLRVAELELTDLTFGQVLVKVLASGICGAQLLEIGGHKGNAKFVPHLLGHEGVGIVEGVGMGVSKVKIGDKVIMHWRKGDGIESDFPTYILDGKPIRSGKVTTFGQYSVVSENRVTAVPHDTPNELCALLGCGMSTALGTINDEAKVRFGESVMIVGAGGMGLNLVKAATLSRAFPVISIDVFDHKRELAESLGAHLFINSKTHNIQDEIFKKFGIKDVDVIIETSGNKYALQDTIPVLSGVGRYILVGQPKPGETIEITNANHLFGGEGKTIKATQGGKFSPTMDIPRYVRLHKAGILNIDGIITHRVKLDDINEAIDLVRKGQASRIMIEM